MLRKGKCRTCKPEDRSLKHIDIIKYLSHSFSALAVPEYKIWALGLAYLLSFNQYLANGLGRFIGIPMKMLSAISFYTVSDVISIRLRFSWALYFTLKLPGQGLEGILKYHEPEVFIDNLTNRLINKSKLE